jgi:hypothetical protein
MRSRTLVRRDWARRYLFQQSLQRSVTAQLVVGEAGITSGSWTDPRSSESLLANFSHDLEFEADAEGLMLMARAGFHRDFMPALYHKLQAQPLQLDPRLHDASHPEWDNRAEKLRAHFAAAGREFDRLWPGFADSPGGNPPVVVYASLPSAHRTSRGGIELTVPLHCENLYGSVEVVLRMTGDSGFARELRQFSGCTSERTLVRFALQEPELPAHVQATISVLDDRGSVLTRATADPVKK